MVRRILERLRERRKRVEEIARRLESRGVAPKAAKRLARLVASGEYTIDEVVKAYKRSRNRRIKRLADSLENTATFLERASRLESTLWDSLGLNLGAPMESGGRAPRRRRRS